MIYFKRNYFLLSLSVLIIGCTPKVFHKQRSALIIFKTPSFKYADLGFIYENSAEMKVELYGSGNALLSLNIDDNRVCFSLFECMESKAFNAKMLNAFYPKNILNSVFRGKKIFNSKNVMQEVDGFSQKIVDEKYNINYRVSHKEILFRDSLNNILIKIKGVE